MATTRRDQNRNFLKWEPVEEGNSGFTPNTPLNWFYEIIDPANYYPCEEEGEDSTGINALMSQEDLLAAPDLARTTPTNDELLRMAEDSPPPPEWFDEDEERPF